MPVDKFIKDKMLSFGIKKVLDMSGRLDKTINHWNNSKFFSI